MFNSITSLCSSSSNCLIISSLSCLFLSFDSFSLRYVCYILPMNSISSYFLLYKASNFSYRTLYYNFYLRSFSAWLTSSNLFLIADCDYRAWFLTELFWFSIYVFIFSLVSFVFYFSYMIFYCFIYNSLYYFSNCFCLFSFFYEIKESFSWLVH